MLTGELHGPADGPSILLLHGGGQSRSSWRIAAEFLGKTGYAALAIDLRGHGDSDWSPDGDYGIEPYVADLLLAIEAMGAPATLVGASFGGHVSLVTAARYPALVRALVLCDVTPWIEGEATRAIRATMCAAAAGFATAEEAARHVGLVVNAASDQEMDRLARRLRRGPDGRFYWPWDPRFFSHHQEMGDHLTDILEAAAATLAVPTLLIRAGRSEIVTPENAAKFKQLVQHTVLAEIAGAGHTIARKDNAAYAAAILAFLSDR